MEEQEKFLEILGGIKDIAALQQNTLEEEEIKKYLGNMALDNAQMEAVYRYLSAGGIKINRHGKTPSIAENTTPESRALYNRQLYQHEVDMLYVPNDNELCNIIKNFLMGEKTFRDKFVESKLAYVTECASRYKEHIAVTNKAISIDEVISEGNVGLLTGISIIEENRAQYIKEDGEPDYKAVNGIINMEITSAMESFIDMETSGKDWESAVLARANLLHEAAKYLTEKNGTRPSKEELSEYTRIPVEEITKIMNLSEDTKRVALS